MKAKPKNIKEAIELIKRYESVSLEEIKRQFALNDLDPAGMLTGFGNKGTCTLCTPVRRKGEEHHLFMTTHCEECIYSKKEDCTEGRNAKTFWRIAEAKTPVKLRNAFRARAKHIRDLLKEKYGVEVN